MLMPTAYVAKSKDQTRTLGTRLLSTMRPFSKNPLPKEWLGTGYSCLHCCHHCSVWFVDVYHCEQEKPIFALSTTTQIRVWCTRVELDAEGTLKYAAETINQLLKLNTWFRLGFVEVRDVGLAHVVAFEQEAAKHQRLILYLINFT